MKLAEGVGKSAHLIDIAKKKGPAPRAWHLGTRKEEEKKKAVDVIEELGTISREDGSQRHHLHAPTGGERGGEK